MIVSAIETIDESVRGLFEVCERYCGAESTHSMQKEYATKKSESLLQVMLFGSYNAGKSSLINALVKDEVAPIGDIPKTAVADRYDWSGGYLLDTPGVNAPIEHEAVAEEQIARSELVLFVIRQGDQDVKDVYERMFSMLAREKQVFIVFNHELNSEALPEALNRLTEIMAKYAVSHDVNLKRVGEIPVLPVNIKTAMKARLKGSEALAEHSGITQFETVFLSWLRKFDSDFHYLDRLRKYIHQCVVAPLLTCIGEEQNDGEEQQLKNLQHQRDELIRQFDLLDAQVANHIRAEMVRLKPQIANVLGQSSSQFELESEMMSLADQVLSSTSDFFQERCGDMVDALSAKVDVDVEVPDQNQRSKVAESIRQAVLTGAKSIDEELLKKGLLFMRKMKIPGVKGRWEKTLGKWAGKANWAITTVVSAYEIYEASSEQDKENSESHRQTLGLHQLVESAANDIESVILDESRKAIDGAKAQSLSDVNANIEILMHNCEQHTLDEESVKGLASKLDAVQI